MFIIINNHYNESNIGKNKNNYWRKDKSSNKVKKPTNM